MSASQIRFKRSILQLAAIILIGLAIAVGLAAITDTSGRIDNWLPYFWSVLIGISVLIVGRLAIQTEGDLVWYRWAVWGVVAAAVLRLAFGVIWYLGLPAWGYGSPVEKAGYIMADAYARDQASWEIARSQEPLSISFSEYKSVDQYGGLLFLSAIVYRFLGGDVHLPLQMVIITASFSALTVFFTWGAVRKLWGEKAANLAAWIVVLFPDAIILGSSQMREAFTMTLVSAAIYGLITYLQTRRWRGLVWLGVGLFLLLPFTPPLAGLLLIALLILIIFFPGQEKTHDPRFWVVVAGIAVVVIAGVWIVWGRLAPAGINDPISLVSWWLKQSARWQAYFVRRSSTLVRKIFKVTPDWTHVFILMVYGVLQPFLPAAVLDSGNLVWKGIAIWRSAGWTVLLIFLLAAPVMAWIRSGWRNVASGISLIVWGGILLASLRSGGDMWDNPRYRVTFIGLQAALAAWAWYERKQLILPWLRWATISLGIFLAWFFPWYLQRSGIIWWPVQNVFLTIGLGILSVILFFVMLKLTKKMGN